jgi:flagellar basal body rod protein FlgF
MIRSLWISKTGLDAQQTQLDVVSNNLANVGTTGFKRARVAFEDLLYQNVRQSGASTSQQTQLPTGLQIGTGVRPTATLPSLAISAPPVQASAGWLAKSIAARASTAGKILGVFIDLCLLGLK